MPTRRGSGSVKTTAQKNKVKKIIKKAAGYISGVGLHSLPRLPIKFPRKTVKKIQNPKKTVKKIIPGVGSAKKAIEANLAKQKAKKLAKK